MSEVCVTAEREIDAPVDRVYRILADYRTHHPRILPGAFSDFRVEAGGVGEGTLIRFSVTAGGSKRSYRQRVEEPEPGRMMREVDLDLSRVTTFTVAPRGSGCHLRIETAWASHGVRGMVERLIAPRILRPIYEDELSRLDTYAREHPDL